MPDKSNDSDELDRNEETEAVEAGSDSVGPEIETLQTVGTTLRLAREERGEELRYVAQVLRIRYPYLKAIEDGLIDELPGPTYAVGFVRTYAEHLGLDTEKMVAQFKAEVEGLNARADLHFPAPLPEGKIPSGAILLVAVVLAAMVYGAWIYLSSKDEQVAEIVPQLPNRISEIIKGKTPENPPETSVVTAPPVTEPPQSETEPSVVSEPVQPAPSDTASEEKTPAPETPVADAPESTPETPTAAPAEPEPPQPAAAEAPTDAASATPEPAEQQIASANPTREAVETPETQQAADSEPAASVTPAARIYGRENSDARIVLRATADSWVEIRDEATNELLLTRVLFKGDSYRVPNRNGLVLLTGNAGGLKISVDGEAVPTLGPMGAVRRNIALEPDRLRARAAADTPSSTTPSPQPDTPEAEPASAVDPAASDPDSGPQ